MRLWYTIKNGTGCRDKELIAMAADEHLWNGPARCNDEKLRQLIRKHSVARSLKPNEVYLSPGDPIYYVAYVAEGVTSHYMFGPNGREKVLYRLGRGWFFSEGIFWNPNHAVEMATRYAIAEKASTLYLIDYENFMILLRNLEFVQAILCSTVEKCTILRHEIESVTFDSTSDRLKQLLLSCVNEGSTEDGQWYNLFVDWTHHDIAAIIGINRVTVSRFITELKQEGFLRLVNGEMQISKRFVHPM